MEDNLPENFLSRSSAPLTRLHLDSIFSTLPFCVAKNEGEDPGIAAATVEGLAFSNRP